MARGSGASLSDDEIEDIAELLCARSAPRNLAGNLSLIRHIRVRFAVSEYWVAARIAWWALDSCLRRDEEQEGKRPLLAARHLLGLYEYPADPVEPFKESGNSLRDYVARAGSGSTTLNLTERQEIAAGEGGYGHRTNLSGYKKGRRAVAESVWSEFNVFLARLSPVKVDELRRGFIAEGPPDWFLTDGAPKEWSALGVLPVAGRAGVLEKSQAGALPESEGSVPVGAAPFLESPRPPRSWRPRRRSLVFAAIAAPAIAVAGLFVGSAFWATPTRSTTVETFVPSATDVSAAAELTDDSLHVTCAQRSYSSARSDARACTGINLLLDPCFLTALDRVVCPKVEDVARGVEGGSALAAVVAESVSVDWIASSDLVGAEQAALTEYPWAFRLDYRDAENEPYFCQADVRGDITFKAAIFSCSTSGVHTQKILDGEAFMRGAGLIAVEYEGMITASDFQRTSPQWTVAVQLPGTNRLTRVAIDEAWF